MRREIRRAQLEPFFAKLAPTEVVLEACAGSHHWGRVLCGMGHRVRLIPPQYVKPFVKRSKNDRNDAEAISEAASRPTMRTVPVKSADEQAATIILKHRELMVNQRTQAINALRGHAAEFGVVAAKGCASVTPLLAVVSAEEAIPAVAKAMFEQGQHIADLDLKINVLELLAKPVCRCEFPRRLKGIARRPHPVRVFCVCNNQALETRGVRTCRSKKP